MSAPDLDDPTLFDLGIAPPPSNLADEFGYPPLSVIDRRSGAWQDRKRRWIATGIRSDLGRGDSLLFRSKGTDPVSVKLQAISPTSVFDPALAELAIRWWSAPGSRVLDPFAGGSVRGVVASALGRHYLGVDIRPEQVADNELQAHLGSDLRPSWVVGDARDLRELTHPDEFDFLFTCPPYADLERYSDDPGDLSTLDYLPFVEAYRQIIRDAVSLLVPDRFAAIVVGDLRGPDGTYRGFVSDTISAFRDAGTGLYNQAIITTPLATAPLRAAAPFRATRKLTLVHQHLLVFVKGDARKAADAATHGSEGQR